jgi:hypothetical protein
MSISIERKPCRRCGFHAHIQAFFRQNRTTSPIGHVYVAKHAVCIGCELSARNDPTPQARALRKARNTIQHHAAKWEMRAPDFAKAFGWDPERMAHDFLHASENTCVYCWFPYADMGHGLDDLTIDILDREKDPRYRTNVRVCCRTCNMEKATMAPELWDQRLIEWAAWRAWMNRIVVDPVHGLPLFASLETPRVAAAAMPRPDTRRGPRLIGT